MSFPINEFKEQLQKKNKSEEYIQVIVEYISNLDRQELPVIFSLEHLSILLKIQSDYLRVLIGDSKEGFEIPYDVPFKYRRYRKFAIQKKKGGHRIIMAPYRDLKFIQKWIAVNILDKVPLTDSAMGFVKGKSIIDNANVHKGARLVLKIDLLRFFDSITERRVYGVFKKLGYLTNLSYSLAKICTLKQDLDYWDELDETELETFNSIIKNRQAVLPQGAPTSPVIANILACNLDKRIEGLADKKRFKYSRYADDMTFSISETGSLPSLDIIYKIIEQEGFFVNTKKTKYFARGQKQYVTGLTVTDSENVHVSKKYRKDIFKHLYYCRKHGVDNHLSKNKKKFAKVTKLKFHDWLYGHICFIHSVDKKNSKKMFEEFEMIKWF